MKRKLCFFCFFILFTLVNYGDEFMDKITEDELYGIPVTIWEYYGSNENVPYCYSLDFLVPDKIYFNFSIKNQHYQNGMGYKTHTARSGTFEIKNNIVIIRFTKSIYDSLYLLEEEWIPENITVEMAVEATIDKLYVKIISGINIFENDNGIVEFIANILPVEI